LDILASFEKRLCQQNRGDNRPLTAAAVKTDFLHLISLLSNKINLHMDAPESVAR
jgi:hypothetical protein